MRFEGPVIVVSWWCLCMVFGSCRDDGSRSGVTVSDSAGVEIVQHSPATHVPTWRLSAGPQVRIGVVEGDPRYEFDSVADALRDRDGRILVLDRSRRRVKVFGADGGFINMSGRHGQGPGEYETPSALWRIGQDSFAVYDPPMGRVSVLDRTGDWVRSVQVRPIRTLVLAAGSFEDGRLLVIDAFPDPENYRLAEARTVSLEGLESLGRFPYIENIGPGPLRDVRRPLVSKMRYMSAGREWLFVARNLGYELEIRDSSGDLQRIVRWHGRDLTATPDALEQYKENLVRNVPEARRASLAENLEERIHNERFPAFGRAIVDRDGRAWLRSWRQPSDTGSTEWTVVSPAGRLEARVQVPYGSTVMEADDEYVLLLVTDDLGVQSVGLYGLDPEG